MTPDMVEQLVIKMFDQPVVIIFHLKINDNISVFFKINGFHLENLIMQCLEFS